jgi:hypothetical protein
MESQRNIRPDHGSPAILRIIWHRGLIPVRKVHRALILALLLIAMPLACRRDAQNHSPSTSSGPATQPAIVGIGASPVTPGSLRVAGIRVFEQAERTHDLLKNVFVVLKFPGPDALIGHDAPTAVETAFRAEQQIVWCPLRSSRLPEYRFRGHWKVNENGELDITGQYEPDNGAVELPARLRNQGKLHYVVTGALLRKGAPPYAHTLDLLIKRATPDAETAPQPAKRAIESRPMTSAAFPRGIAGDGILRHPSP